MVSFSYLLFYIAHNSHEGKKRVLPKGGLKRGPYSNVFLATRKLRNPLLTLKRRTHGLNKRQHAPYTPHHFPCRHPVQKMTYLRPDFSSRMFLEQCPRARVHNYYSEIIYSEYSILYQKTHTDSTKFLITSLIDDINQETYFISGTLRPIPFIIFKSSCIKLPAVVR